MLDIFCDKIDPNTQCYGAGAGGAESFCVPGAGAEIIFLIKIYGTQSGSCEDEEKLISTPISIVLLLYNSFKWQYIAGAGAEILDKGGAGAENK